jgi:hypothetical protein
MSRYYGKKPVTEPVVLVPVAPPVVDTPVDDGDDNDVPVDDGEEAENDS